MSCVTRMCKVRGHTWVLVYKQLFIVCPVHVYRPLSHSVHPTHQSASLGGLKLGLNEVWRVFAEVCELQLLTCESVLTLEGWLHQLGGEFRTGVGARRGTTTATGVNEVCPAIHWPCSYSMCFVTDLVRCVHVNKAAVPDGMCVRALHPCSRHLSGVFLLFPLSVYSRHVPDIWKLADIVDVHHHQAQPV